MDSCTILDPETRDKIVSFAHAIVLARIEAGLTHDEMIDIFETIVEEDRYARRN